MLLEWIGSENGKLEGNGLELIDKRFKNFRKLFEILWFATRENKKKMLFFNYIKILRSKERKK